MASSSNYLKNRKNKTIIQNLIDGIKQGDYIYDKFSFTNDKFIIKDLELQTNSFNTDNLRVPTLKTNQIIFNDGNIFDFSGTVLRFGDYKIDLINVSNGDVSSIQFWEASYVNTRDLSVNRNAVINNLEVSGIEISNNAIVKNNLTVNNILTVDNSANILDLSVGSITLGTVRRTTWPTGSTTSTSVWTGSDNDISYSLGNVTIHKNLDVSGLDVSNNAKIQGTLTVDKSANILDLSVGSITLGTVRRTAWPTGSTTSTSVWSGSDNDISYSLGNVTIHKNLDVSGLDVSNNATIKRNLTVNNKIQATDISVTNIDVSGTINVNKIDIKEHIYFENDISVNGTLGVSGSIFLGNTNTKKPTFTLTSESGQQPFIMLQRGNGNWKLDTDNDNDNKPKHNNSFGLSISDIGLEIFKNNDQDNTVMSDRINNREQCLIIDNSTGNVGIGKRFNTFLDQTGKVYDNGVKLNDDTNDKHGIKYISKATHTLTIIDGSFIIDYSRNPLDSLDPKKKYNTVVKNYHLPDGSGGAANICLNTNYVSNTDVSVVDVSLKYLTNGLIWRPEHNHYNKESAKIVFQIEDGSYQGGLGFYTNNSTKRDGDVDERMHIDMNGRVDIYNKLVVGRRDVLDVLNVLDVDDIPGEIKVDNLFVDNIKNYSIDDNLTIDTDCSFNNNVEISGNLVVKGGLTVKGKELKFNTTSTTKEWWYTSDDRIKHNEKPIENSLDILNNLQPYRYIKTKEMYAVDHHFQLNEQGEPLDDSGNVIEDYIIEMGIIAQDVEKMDYLKQLVHKPDGEDGIFYLRYNDLFVLNIDATKTLSNKVSNLENKDNDILAKINNIPEEECFIIEFKDNMEMNRDNTNRDDKGRYHSIKINTNTNSNSNWTISNRYFYKPIIKKTYNSENINIIKDIFNSDLYGSVNIDGTKLFPLTNSFIDIILEYNVTIEIESRIIDASKYNNTNNNMLDLGFMFQMYSNLENNIYNNCYEKIQIHNVTPPLNEDFYNSDTNPDKKKYFTYTQQINKEFKLSLSPNTGDKLYKFLESAKNTTIQLGYSIFTNGFRNKDITNTYPPSLYLDNYPWDRVEIPPSTKYANPDIDFKNPFYITVKSSSLKIKTKKLF